MMFASESGFSESVESNSSSKKSRVSSQGNLERAKKRARIELEENLLNDLEYERPTTAKPKAHTEEIGDRTKIAVKDFSYPTYLAMIKFLYTGTVNFSSVLSLPGLIANKLVNSSNRADPRQIYRLADKLDLKNLKELAKKQIILNLNPGNIGLLVFGTFADTFDEIKQEAVNFIVRNWKDVSQSIGWDLALGLVTGGEGAGTKETLKQILEAVANSGSASVSEEDSDSVSSPRRIRFIGKINRI